ncbi:MAG: hypothetical protein ACOC5U_04955, partial [Candidatus Aminicenantaceae bacterium]
GILAEKDKGSVTALMINADKKNGHIHNLPETHKNHRKIHRSRIILKHIKAPDISKAILKEAEKYDLIIIGATRDPLLRKVAKDSIPNMVAKNCRKPLIIAKSTHGLRSWLRRWI